MLAATLILLTVLISASHQQCFSGNDAAVHSDAKEYYWLKSRQNFSINLLKTLNKERSRENLVFSPWSIQEALLLAYFGAAHDTEDSLAKVLQIPATQAKPDTWRFYYTAKKTQVSKEVTMKTANKIFMSNKLSFRPCMQEKFGNELELIDFQTDNAQWAKNHINEWVESVTEGNIKNFIKELSPDSKMELVNAVYFKSKWLYQFFPNMTKTMIFHLNRVHPKPAKMMTKQGVFKEGYSASLGAKLLLLPYEGNTTAMIVLLPTGDLDSMINKMNDATFAYLTHIDNFHSSLLHVAIPKYEHRSGITLNSALASLGIGNALTPSAHYPGFTGKEEVLFKKVIHQAVIKVDEEGTTAAASTAIHSGYSAPIVSNFHCDRPFAYVIYDFKDRKILFVGTFRDPSK